MKWRGRQRSSNVEDRRGQRAGGLGGLGGRSLGRGGGMPIPLPIGRGGGLGGIGVLVLIGIVLFAMGINPLSLIGLGDPATQTQQVSTRGQPLPAAGEDELADFVGVVIQETENLWEAQFTAVGANYPAPRVVLFSGQTQSGCGLADSRVGPFYCPGDESVYIDLSFYEQLHREFGAPGDFAQAYVLAHEVGHHIQNLTGVLPEFNAARASMSAEEANAFSVRVELQADCYAGVWANYVGEQNLLEDGDIEEAINAASQIGDDTLQRRMQGFAVPKSFTHGTSAQRRTWFERGYQTGDPDACDTFTGSI